MKKIVTILLLPMFLFAFGCFRLTRTVSGISEAFMPEAEIPAGKYEMVFSEGMDMSTDTGSFSVTVKNKQTEYLELVAEPKSPDGKQKLSMEWKRVTFKQDSQALSIDYDSADPEKQASVIPNLDILIGLKLDLVMDETGKIVEVSGHEEFMDAKIAENPDKKNIYEMHKEMMAPEFLSRYFRDYEKIMPKTPVSAGEEWTVETKIVAPLLGDFDTEQKIRFEKAELVDGAKTGVISSVAKTGPNKGHEAGFGSFKMKYSHLEIEDSDTITINLESGLIKSHITKRKLRTESSVGGDSQKTKTSNDVTVSMELKPLE